MGIAFLLALQASGMVVDWLGENQQVKLGKMGEKIEQAGINANIQTTRLETEDASLQAMKQLRMNLGTQAVMLAARGQRGGVGTALAFQQESLSNFKTDERMRRMNQLGNEARLKAGVTLSKLHQQAFEGKSWNEFRTRTVNRIPTSPSAWGKIGESFGLTKV